jgi:hypothetical protein
MSFGKYFRSTLFHCSVDFHGLHIRLTSLPVINSFGGYLNAKVYTSEPRTIDDLNIAIRKQISAIPENMATRALGVLRAKLEECVRKDGQHLSDALFKTK